MIKIFSSPFIIFFHSSHPYLFLGNEKLHLHFLGFSFYLTSFIQHNYVEIHLCCSGSLFLHTARSSLLYQLCHNLFIHTPVDRQLCCFQFLANAYTATMNIHV